MILLMKVRYVIHVIKNEEELSTLMEIKAIYFLVNALINAEVNALIPHRKKL